MFRRRVRLGNLRYGKISPDSSDVTNAETGEFSITISNDTTEYVNVSFTVSYPSLSGKRMTALARPQMETEKKGSFNQKLTSPEKVTITGLNGTKCQ